MTLNRFLKVIGHQDKRRVLKYKPLRNINLRKYVSYRNSRDHRSWPGKEGNSMVSQHKMPSRIRELGFTTRLHF